ncbi:SUKH-4 family immunity protein [Streptomyces sp. NPDC002734]|uniref:SUKH-4 family immunity protein n=1 Tax=Streptomyces sp. NPDC002734 TaxID=3154426 RepID=UPI00332BBC83
MTDGQGEDGYTPGWLRAAHWGAEGLRGLPPTDTAEVAAWPAPVRRALEVAHRYGLPTEADHCWPGTADHPPFSRVDDRFWRLAVDEALHTPEFVLDGHGRVWALAPGVDPAERFVNSSLLAYLDALAAWEHRCEHLDDFDDLEPDDPDSDDDPAGEARVAFGLAVRDRLRELDPPAFDPDTWWDRVDEEVEFDAI